MGIHGCGTRSRKHVFRAEFAGDRLLAYAVFEGGPAFSIFKHGKRAAELAAIHDIPLVYTDYREMIAQASLDAVVVAARDDLHYPVVMEALDAGLHVLCEKPLATTADQARAMYEKAEAGGRIHMVFFTWPWLAHYQQLPLTAHREARWVAVDDS